MAQITDYEKIKQSVEEAKTKSAEISGQIKGKISQLNELGFNGEDPIAEANDYLDTQEPILDELEKNIEKQKQKISDDYTNIIKSTAPGTEDIEEGVYEAEND